MQYPQDLLDRVLSAQLSHHAPRGGIRIAGMPFKGGQFIPPEYVAAATPGQRAKLTQPSLFGGDEDAAVPPPEAPVPEPSAPQWPLVPYEEEGEVPPEMAVDVPPPPMSPMEAMIAASPALSGKAARGMPIGGIPVEDTAEYARAQGEALGAKTRTYPDFVKAVADQGWTLPQLRHDVRPFSDLVGFVDGVGDNYEPWVMRYEAEQGRAPAPMEEIIAAQVDSGRREPILDVEATEAPETGVSDMVETVVRGPVQEVRRSSVRGVDAYRVGALRKRDDGWYVVSKSARRMDDQGGYVYTMTLSPATAEQAKAGEIGLLRKELRGLGAGPDDERSRAAHDARVAVLDAQLRVLEGRPTREAEVEVARQSEAARIAGLRTGPIGDRVLAAVQAYQGAHKTSIMRVAEAAGIDSDRMMDFWDDDKPDVVPTPDEMARLTALLGAI